MSKKLVVTSTARVPARRVSYLVRGRIAPHFVDRSAVSPDEAIEFRPVPRDASAFERMRREGSIRAEADGRFWFDADAYDAAAAARGKRLVPYAILGSVVVAALLVLLYQG